ncbi:MAG: hypothetical protein ISR65_20610 [Bacteriovoracaceae bacterium]|nr:hypothetical protein [Candidatus Brocadiales bacterium]MBL6992199.1 hypothetical protein [Bacteriovoracaceae bacterium]
MSDLFDTILKISDVCLSGSSIDRKSIWNIANQLHDSMSKNILPRRGQSAIIAPNMERIAALCYDKIWSGIPSQVPEDIRFFGGTYEETVLSTTIFLEYAINQVLDSDDKQKLLATKAAILRVFFLENPGTKLKAEEITERINSLDHSINNLSRIVSTAIIRDHNLPIPTLYSSMKNHNHEYIHGDRKVIISCLNDLAIPDQSLLTWEQVIEFRQDEEARSKYRRLMHWLDAEMIGKSTSYIEEEIAQRLDQYSWSLKKHGIKAHLGTLWSILDHKTLLAVAVSAGGLSLSGYDLAAALGSAGILVGRCALKLADAYLDLKDIEIGKGAEISFVYQIRKSVG